MRSIYPIYHPLFLQRAKDELRKSPSDSVDDAFAQISKLADTYSQPPLPKGLVADLWALQDTGYLRPALRDVTPPLVLVDVTEKGRLARLKMEWIKGDGCSGILYPHPDMAGSMDDEGKHGGIFTDAAWDGALTAALGHAEANDFRIAQTADVRWRVELVNEADAYARQDVATAETEPWKPGSLLQGRSAGAAFLIGLVYLGQRAREGLAIGSEIRSKVSTLLPLLVLPTLPEHGPLRELGAMEQPKLDALERHLANLTLIFPETHRQDLPLGAMLAPDVAALIRHVVDRIKSEIVPDTIPLTLRAGHYVNSGKVGALMDSLRQPGVVIVHGLAGIGKTAFVIEAVRSLVEKGEGDCSGGRLYIDLTKRMPLVVNPPFLGEAAPPFEGLPRYSNSWITDRVLDSLQEAMLTDIVSGLDGVPSEDLPKLKTQARDLLAGRSVLVVLEGAENVPEAYISDFLEPLGGNTHVAWLTRRKPNPGVQGLDGRPAYEVFPLSLNDSRELLCYHAGLDPTTLDDATRAGVDSIARDAEFIPQFLVWAGRAIGHNNPRTPAQIAKEIQQIAREIQADRLTEFTNPDRRDANARRFLEGSLTRIQPALAATARRLFAALSVFHPAHGAPEDLWALAAELDTAQRTQQREFIAARRELLSLRLAVLDDKQNAYPVHSLAAALATALWHEQPAETRTTALSLLARAAVQYLAVPPPPDWPRNAEWLATTAAIALHSNHWITSAGFDPSSDIGGQLTAAWVHLWTHFSDGTLELQQHPLGLLESVGSAVCAHLAALAREYPKHKKYLLQLAIAWSKVGSFRRGWQDWTGAEQAYREALTVVEALAREYPQEVEYEFLGSDLWESLGDVLHERRDWTGAEQAYAKALTIAEALALEYPRNQKYLLHLSGSLDRLAEVRSRRQDRAETDQGYDEALTIAEALARENPKEPKYHIRLVTSWDVRGNVCRARRDWTGAEQAYAKALTIAEALAREYPEVRRYKAGLGCARARMAEIAEHAEDWSEAVARWQRACETWEQLVAANPGETLIEEILIAGHLSLARAAARAGEPDLAHTAAEAGIARGFALRAALEAAGLEQSERQQQVLVALQRLVRDIDDVIAASRNPS